MLCYNIMISGPQFFHYLDPYLDRPDFKKHYLDPNQPDIRFLDQILDWILDRITDIRGSRIIILSQV